MTPSDPFQRHVSDALGVPSHPFGARFGGTIAVVEKRPENGPVTFMTSGVSELPTDSGERVEFAVELVDGQQNAARYGLGQVCADIVINGLVPRVGAPWRSDRPILDGTRISAVMATPSRWGAAFDEIRAEDGELVGHVRTLRLLTDAEAGYAAANGLPALVEAAGSVDALLDVERDDAVASVGVPATAPVFLSKLHAQYPPRWVSYIGTDVHSLTGLESDEYLEDPANFEISGVDTFVGRFPWVAGFIANARRGDHALFTDASGDYVLEDE